MEKMVGHNFLAKLGKTRLRPGGVTATKWLIHHGKFSSKVKVLDVACNMCTTSIELARSFHCHITALDLEKKNLEKAKININNNNVEKYIDLIQGNALKLPFEDNSFDIVINEAMLTMLNNKAKEKALKEYYRVLKPGGKLLTHDITFYDDNLVPVIDKLKTTININVCPLPVTDWEKLIKKSGFSSVESDTGDMTLMSFQGMIKDEGLLNTLRIIKNGQKKENKAMFKKMHGFFTNEGKQLKYIAICSEK
ncbi:class I SAM-dependent methyltransferase [Enterococcus sp. LJL90]